MQELLTYLLKEVKAGRLKVEKAQSMIIALKTEKAEYPFYPYYRPYWTVTTTDTVDNFTFDVDTSSNMHSGGELEVG